MHHATAIKSLLVRLCVIAATLLPVTSVCAKDYHVYFLAGQSNMDGRGLVAHLPKEHNAPVPGVMIFHSPIANDHVAPTGIGAWSVVRPGHGGFATDGKTHRYGKWFGPELTMARRLKECYPDRNIAIVKYARGASALDDGARSVAGCWNPQFKIGDGINQFDHFVATWRKAKAVKDINDDGDPDRLIPAGFGWLQGESDANHKDAKIAARYEANLKHLVAAIRREIGAPDLPAAIVRIAISADAPTKPPKPWRYPQGTAVRQAQADFVKTDGHAALVDTDDLGFSDSFHYNTMGFVAIGHRVADAFVSLDRTPHQGARFIRSLEAGEQVTIGTMGTSLTGGKWRWVDVMKHWLDERFPDQVTIHNFGIGASASERFLPGRSGLDMLPKVIASQPDVVFIEFAINDAHRPYGISLERSKHNLNTIIDRILAADSKTEIILQTMNAVTGTGAGTRPQLPAYYEGYRNVARRRGLLLVDHYPNWVQLLNDMPQRFTELVPDGVHPQAPGYRAIVLPELKKALAARSGQTAVED